MLLARPRLSTVKPALQCILLVVSLCFPCVVGVGVFEVKLGDMHNPGGRDANGACCTGSESNDGKCTSPCNTRIITCLRQYSPAHPADCTYGYNVSGLLGSNSFVLEELVRFPISSNWPGSFSLKVTAEVPGTKKTIIEALVKRKSFVANPQWNNYTYTIPSSGGLKISLSLTYRFICSQNNYGDDCSKSCIPRNDHFGHYTCDANGDIVCLDGWGSGPSDTFCENPICNPACQNGQCSSPNTCSCVMGWQGATCEQCQVYPGCVHGTCQNKWECNCNSGWGGPYCDLELDYCGRNRPCVHGDCRNTRPGRYKCLCDRGYGGLNCESEINECASSPCQNGGNCTDKLASYNCSCPVGFRGKQCEINFDDCQPNACANAGTCVDGINSYSCRCPGGFTGRACDVKMPTENPTKLSTKPFNSTYNTTTNSHGNNSVVGGQRKDDTSSWRNIRVIVLPVVIFVIIIVCLIIWCVIGRYYRNRCCCCCAGASTSNRDPEEPNTRTEVKRVDPDGKDVSDVDDLKRCRASTSNVKNTTPDIIINFVPSRSNQKNVNSEQASRTKKGKEVADLSPLENTRQSLELTDIIPEQDLGELFLPNRCFDNGYWQEVEVDL